MALSDEDFSQPVSVVLRKGTVRAHEAAERSEGAALLIKGQLEKLEYVRLLMMLWIVYSALEAGLDKHRDEPILKPTYKPDILSRTTSLSSDIAFLLGTSEWQRHGIYQELSKSPPSQLSTFTNRLYSLSSSSDTSYLFLAHAYVRYFGDLSGGQMIRKQIVKSYNLPHTGDGIRFYMFSSGEEELNPTDIKELKKWYRDGMDLGVGDDKLRKEALMNEAILSFQLNQELFAAVRRPKKIVCVEKPSASIIPSALGLLQLSVGKYIHAMPRGSTAIILVVALFGVIQFISSGL